jgi:predicted  nucleic acid-binding Zn-ribbon protein
MADPNEKRIATLEAKIKELSKEQDDLERRLKEAEGSLKDLWPIVTEIRKKVGVT